MGDITTLSDLIHSKRITMYRVLPTEQGAEAILVAQSTSDETVVYPYVNITISDRPDFLAVFDSGIESIQALDGKTYLSIYPITDKQNIVGLLEIVSDHP